MDAVLLTRRGSVVLAATLLVVQLGVSASNAVDPLGTADGGFEPPAPVNFLIIVSDDQRFDSMSFMPLTRELVFNKGVQFPNAFITTSACCPARVSLLTGLYAAHHGVVSNFKEDAFVLPSFTDALHENGYYTGLVGKYLNNWNGTARAGYDRWVSFAYGDSTYNDPELNIDGEWQRVDGYITDILRDEGLRFLEEANTRDQPFALLFHPNAPHRPATPAPEDRDMRLGVPQHRPPNFNEEDVSDKPQWVQDTELEDGTVRTIDRLREDMLRTLPPMDRAIAALIERLEFNGMLENTFIVFLSDNGFFWGEHRLFGKNHVYEESVRVPFAVRYDPLTGGEARTDDAVVANIDLAPTVYELAGVEAIHPMDGRSLVSRLAGGEDWRRGVILEGWQAIHWTAYHTGDRVYVDNGDQRNEYYDLTLDPFQLDNRVDDPEHRDDVDELRGRLADALEQRRAVGEVIQERYAPDPSPRA